MSEAGQQRLRAVQTAFREATLLPPGEGASGDTARLAGLLRIELLHWQAIGFTVGYFEEEPTPDFVDDAAAAALNTYTELTALAGIDSWSEFPDVEVFQDALVAAIEDLRAERLELVRLMRIADPEERRTRILEVREVAGLVEEAGLAAVTDIGRISWALSGRDTAIQGQPGPAAWRSNTAIERAPDFEELNEAGIRLAIAVLSAELGSTVDHNDILDTVNAETRGYGPATEA